VDVENVGQVAGDEIVQVYVRDVVTSATWVDKALKGFGRVHLKPGERQTVQVELAWEAFQLVNATEQTVVEAGAFEILVGASSRERDLLKMRVQVE
jgi:beta-glucosidase